MEPEGKGGCYVGLTTLPFLCDDSLEIWTPEPPGTLWACNGPVRGFHYIYPQVL